jgi:hypothetical protein
VKVRTDKNIKQTEELARSDPSLGVRDISTWFNIARETVRKTLVENLGMRKRMCQNGSKEFNDRTKVDKKNRLCWFVGNFECWTAEPHILDTVVTGDESWITAYNPETKRQSMQWKTKNSPGTPHKKKACMSKSKKSKQCFHFLRFKRNSSARVRSIGSNC